MINRPHILFFSFLISIAILMASLPMSLLHDHHHNTCSLASSLPFKIKSEKGSSMTHLHEKSDDCFLCFKSHQLLSVLLQRQDVLNLNFHVVLTQELQLFQHLVFKIDLKDRAPPVWICS